MEKPRIAQTKPYYAELRQGRKYFWCACGRSRNQPFCDGSHKGTGFEPVPYTAAAEGEEVLLCGCKRTRTPPFCDGTHNNLPGGYTTDDPDSPENAAIPEVAADSSGTRRLNGGCYVVSTRHCDFSAHDGLRYCQIIGTARGARYQSQFYLELDRDETPTMRFGDAHVIVFVGDGDGAIEISGREFSITAGDGVYVRPGEAFRFRSDKPESLSLYVSACPAIETIEWPEAMPQDFDDAHPDRVVPTNREQRHTMGKRFFQMLVDKSIGSDVVTQFIGNIPESKAEPHRHLYEESLIILNGRGYIWTDDRKAAIGPGDIVFLPRKQIHSVQCTVSEGMDVVGVIYPGDNPSINY